MSFAELVTGCSGKKRAWGLRYDCTYAMIYMHATLWGGLVCDYGCVWPCNVFGALGLSGFNLLG